MGIIPILLILLILIQQADWGLFQTSHPIAPPGLHNVAVARQQVPVHQDVLILFHLEQLSAAPTAHTETPNRPTAARPTSS